MKPNEIKSIPFTVLLIDDQKIIGEAVKRMMQDQSDATFYFCDDPTQAITRVLEVNPTVILLDLIMPKIEGLELLRQMRQNPKTKEIPVIVLSVKEDPEMKAKSFALGANDYLVKLPNPVELIARMRYHSNAYIHLLERNDAYSQLEQSQKELQHELAEAAGYVTSLLPPILRGSIQTEWRFIPSTSLGGDTFGYHWIDNQNFAIYLLDVCGHGVGAALLSISIVNVLRMQSLLHADFCDPASVLEALNRTFQMEDHNNMFFTIWYGVYHQEKRELTYASAGHPPAVLLMNQHQTKELKTEGMAIGVMSDVSYQRNKVEVMQGDELFLFSDGVYEIFKSDGSLLQFEEFVELIKKKPSVDSFTLDYIVEMVQDMQGKATFADDFSLLHVAFN